MLLCVDGKVLEIRPGEILQTQSLVDSRYLELINDKPKVASKVGRPKKRNIKESLDGSSTSQS